MSENIEILDPTNFARRLQDVASYTSKKFPQGYLFFTLVIPAGENQVCRYVSNGSRETIIHAMKEFIIRNGAGEEWMHDKFNVQLAMSEMKPQMLIVLPGDVVECKICGTLPWCEVLMTDDGEIHFARFGCRGTQAHPHEPIITPFRRERDYARGEWHGEMLKR